jgi:hypothetical protein
MLRLRRNIWLRLRIIFSMPSRNSLSCNYKT